jgi:hypothetical protein
MIPPEPPKAASELVDWIRQGVNEQPLPASNRNRASAACFGIAQEHHHAIVLLMQHYVYAPSFSLLRVAFEAYVRGVWLSLCASDSEVESFLAGDKPPKIDHLLAAIEQDPCFSEKVLSCIKGQSWKAMCGYTHTGGLHVQRWNTAAAIEPNYEVAEVVEVLRFAEVIALMSVAGIARLAGNGALGLKAQTKLEELAGMDSSPAPSEKKVRKF